MYTEYQVFDLIELTLMYYLIESAKFALRNQSSIWSFWKPSGLFADPI